MNIKTADLSEIDYANLTEDEALELFERLLFESQQRLKTFEEKLKKYQLEPSQTLDTTNIN